MKGKLVGGLLIIVCLLMGVNMITFAEEILCGGDIPVGNDYQMTPEEEKAIEEKLEALEIWKNQRAQSTFATIGVPCYQQENRNYCGPATVKQVVQYLNGTSQPQKYYADLLGTNEKGTVQSKIATVLRNVTGKNYQYYPFEGIGKWTDCVCWGIDFKMPAILDINTEWVPEWKYETRGHFLNVSGYDLRNTAKKQIRVTDPFWEGLGNNWYTLNSVFNANNNHGNRAIVW